MQIHYCLLITSRGGEVVRVPVGDSPITIGRLPECTICIDEPSISRRHCMISPIPGGLLLVDQGSSNGTFVNGKKTQNARLGHSDQLRVGSSIIRVQAQSTRDPRAKREQKRAETISTGSLPSLEPERQLSLFGELAKRLGRAEDARASIGAVLDAVTQVFPAEHVMVAMGEPVWQEEGQVVFPSGGCLGSVSGVGRDEALIAKVVTTCTPEARLRRGPPVGAASPEPRDRERGVVLCAPISRSQRALGVLYAELQGGIDWKSLDELLAFFSTIADVAALSLLQDHQPAPRASADDRSCLPLDPDTSQAVEEARIELAEKLAQLEHLQKTRATSARGLVHDIKNLIGALHSNHCFIRQWLPPGSDGEEAMDDADETARRIISMAEDLLTVSQLEEGHRPISPRETQVLTMLEHALRRHAAQAVERSVNLALGPVAEELLALVDPEVFDRVLDNLIGNALRHAGHDGHVHLSGRLARDHVEITIADSGPGVPPSEREKIFTEWYRSGGTSGRHHGIGLYFCRIAVESHGGEIRVKGTPGDNRFVLSIPAVNESEEYIGSTMVELADSTNALKEISKSRSR
jgi:signal transduction histidine kinase